MEADQRRGMGQEEEGSVNGGEERAGIAADPYDRWVLLRPAEESAPPSARYKVISEAKACPGRAPVTSQTTAPRGVDWVAASVADGGRAAEASAADCGGVGIEEEEAWVGEGEAVGQRDPPNC